MVKKISWKDFKLEPSKPNLIQNGWDDFEPFGSGKNYVDNWNFESDDLSEFLGGIEKRKEGGSLYTEARGPHNHLLLSKNLPEGEYLFRTKVKSSHGVHAVAWENTSLSSKKLEPSKEYKVWEIKFSTEGDKESVLRFYPTNGPTGSIDKGQNMVFDWVQITPLNNQHLVVEKTPLGNGLTRIQTWGGNNTAKLQYINSDLKKEIDKTTSVFVENLGDPFVFTDGTGYLGITETIQKGDKVFITHPHKDISRWVYVRSLDIEKNLDFIASDPVIVEGDKANPVLIVTPLDDGREHVQVHGAYPDTKLVYKGGNAIIGEPYVIESEIENLGAQLQMESTLDSVGKVIDKGINQVNIKGTADSKDFEIGVKLRDGTI